MYLYHKLNTPKETVRGVGAASTLFQTRLLVYIALGVFRQQDMAVYFWGAVGNCVGTAFGTWVLFRHVSQAGFRAILLALMCVCCVLLFVSAAGVTSAPAASDSHGGASAGNVTHIARLAATSL